MPEQSDEQDAIREVLRGAPSWITVEIMQDTLRAFRPCYGAGITPGDALEILLNVGNLFEVLAEEHRPQE
jgi:hypothetical protein